MHRVLLICVGNSCRSQMAEGFAKRYGSGVLQVESAGLYPASSVSRLTREVMAERDVDLKGHYPKGLSEVRHESFDVIVNMSGHMLPVETKARVLHWEIEDPIGADKRTYEEVARQIEERVRSLVDELRTGGSKS
jgi:arsenate reductase